MASWKGKSAYVKKPISFGLNFVKSGMLVKTDTAVATNKPAETDVLGARIFTWTLRPLKTRTSKEVEAKAMIQGIAIKALSSPVIAKDELVPIETCTMDGIESLSPKKEIEHSVPAVAINAIQNAPTPAPSGLMPRTTEPANTSVNKKLNVQMVIGV